MISVAGLKSSRNWFPGQLQVSSFPKDMQWQQRTLLEQNRVEKTGNDGHRITCVPNSKVAIVIQWQHHSHNTHESTIFKSFRGLQLQLSGIFLFFLRNAVTEKTYPLEFQNVLPLDLRDLMGFESKM